jgi:hypothetical protein
MKWQTGDYQQNNTFKFELPLPFLMLCRLADVTPQQMITDFMDNLSLGSWKREGKDKGRQALVEYFIEIGYGQKFYTQEELRTMFKEMDAVGLLFPKEGEPEVLEAYSNFRETHNEYWFNKWYR